MKKPYYIVLEKSNLDLLEKRIIVPEKRARDFARKLSRENCVETFVYVLMETIVPDVSARRSSTGGSSVHDEKGKNK